MTDIKLTDEQLQQISEAMEKGGDITLSFSKPRWEPVAGGYHIHGCSLIHRTLRSDKDYRLAGNERVSMKQAELDAKAKRIFDRMLAYRAEFAPMYEPKNNSKNWYIYQNYSGAWQCNPHVNNNNPTLVYLPKQIADDLVVKLNAGTVVF